MLNDKIDDKVVDKAIDALVGIMSDENETDQQRKDSVEILGYILAINSATQLQPGECCFQCGYEHDGPWCVGE